MVETVSERIYLEDIPVEKELSFNVSAWLYLAVSIHSLVEEAGGECVLPDDQLGELLDYVSKYVNSDEDKTISVETFKMTCGNFNIYITYIPDVGFDVVVKPKSQFPILKGES